MTSSDKTELIVKEYEQATEVCRNHDSLIRTGITIFGAAQVAILAVIEGQNEFNSCYTLLLIIIGFWLSIVIWYTTFRLGHRYASYMNRAKKLEKKLGFKLYSSSQKSFKRKWYLSKMPGNKFAMASLPVLVAILYVVLFVNHWGEFTNVICGGSCIP